MNSNRDGEGDRLNVNGNNWNDNNNGCAFGMALATKIIIMKTHKNLYPQIISLDNLILAWRKARKGKTKKDYFIKFEKNLIKNLLKLQEELIQQNYVPKPLKTFILRDPKTRKISKSDFRDRIVHHALVRIIEPIFDKRFIYDSCANRKGKGNLFALERFYKFIRKISESGKVKGAFNRNQIKGYCFKADIKHYFEEVNHYVLIKIIMKKISDKKVIWLIKQILANTKDKRTGMPLGNLTSQFFANVYLNELDYFIKHELRAKYYVRYVDDFVILNNSKMQLHAWKHNINEFLKDALKLELHTQKSRIISLSKGIDFVGFRNFYYFKLLRKKNIIKMLFKIKEYKQYRMSGENLLESFQGWNAYAKWADTYKMRILIFYSVFILGLCFSI